MLEARAKLADIQVAYPELAKEENVTEVIQKIDDALATKLYVTADFYRRTRDYSGAVYTYRYLINLYPQASRIADARAALATMPKVALEQPEPQPGAQYMPPEENDGKELR